MSSRSASSRSARASSPSSAHTLRRWAPPSGALSLRRAAPHDAPRILAIYLGAPSYFDIISVPMPTLIEVEGELTAALQDPKRCTELLVQPGGQAVGYLDYKLDYPEAGDATVNLLLIPEPLQSLGYGRACVAMLEARLRSGLKGPIKRVLASVYGQNPRAERFWRSLGYRFAIDAKPILEWYAKEL